MGRLYVMEVFCVVSFIVCTSLCNSELRLRSFSRDRSMENKVYTSSLLGQISVKGRFDCISSCGIMAKCRYAVYSPISNQCMLNDNGVDKIEDRRGWQSWSIKEMLGNQCSDSRECNYEFGSCVEGNCSCVIGYSYDVTSGQCVTRCASYGSSFTMYKKSSVDHYARQIHYITRKKCVEACLDEKNFVCISVEFSFKKIIAICNLSNETWSNVNPTARQAGTNPGWDLYYRHCKN